MSQLFARLCSIEKAISNIATGASGAVIGHNFTTNSAVELTFSGGQGQLAAQGVFDGGTLALNFSVDDGVTWTLLEDDPASSMTEDGSFAFKSMATDASSYRLQLELTGAGGLANINIRVGDNL
jgi:hypothetical protein